MINVEAVVKNEMVFSVYEENMENFKAKIVKLQNKASKIGNGNVGYVVLSEEFVEENKIIIDDFGRERKIKVIYKKFNIEITGADVPKIEGWSFVATIIHEGAMNLINKVPTHEALIPERFRTSGTWCEHCKSDRRRNDTYILFNEGTGEYKQVGKTCLKDFLGHQSPLQIARYAEFLIDMKSSNEFERVGSCESKYTDMIDWMAMSVAVVNKSGYVSKAKAEENMSFPTSSLVKEQIFDIERLKASAIITPTEEDILKAEQIIEYIRGIDAKTDYEINIKTIANEKYMTMRNRGYATSFVPFYAKAMDLIKEKKTVIPSKHVGIVGDKVEIEVTIDKVIKWDNQFGVTKLHIMKDNEGNVFTWKTSSANLEEGKTFNIKATVKAHTEYKEVNQTELLRVKTI